MINTDNRRKAERKERSLEVGEVQHPTLYGSQTA